MRFPIYTNRNGCTDWQRSSNLALNRRLLHQLSYGTSWCHTGELNPVRRRERAMTQPVVLYDMVTGNAGHSFDMFPCWRSLRTPFPMRLTWSGIRESNSVRFGENEVANHLRYTRGTRLR